MASMAPCKWYMTSEGCRRGSTCHYSHDLASIPCRYGKLCRYKDINKGCWFDHGEPVLDLSLEALQIGPSSALPVLGSREPSPPAAASMPACKHYIKFDGCDRRSICPFRHDIPSIPCKYGERCSGKDHDEEPCLFNHGEAVRDLSSSQDKTCDVCLEVVLEKPSGLSAKFGILSSCIHCFCVDCIRKWRQTGRESCPVCRQDSDYVCPSQAWVETSAEKETLLAEYKRRVKHTDLHFRKML